MAVKIIRTGPKAFKGYCSLCGCEFSYQCDDVESSGIGSQGSYFYVECPNCGYEVKHKPEQQSDRLSDLHWDTKTDYRDSEIENKYMNGPDWAKEADWLEEALSKCRVVDADKDPEVKARPMNIPEWLEEWKKLWSNVKVYDESNKSK